MRLFSGSNSDTLIYSPPDDISSERELMRMLPYRLDYLWFLGLGLDDAVPDHSVLSKARRR